MMYRQPGMLTVWEHDPPAPWQDAAWLESMRRNLRPNAFRRMIQNQWVSTESSFVDLSWWDACVDANARPQLGCFDAPVSAGVDASIKRDATAIVLTRWDDQAKAVRVIWHRIFQPSPENPLDFEATIEATLLELHQRFRLSSVRFDPYQMIASAQRLSRAGLPMLEFPQTPANLTEASQNLFELVKARNLRTYPDAEMRLAISRAIAIEGARGWRIAKEKSSHKIDVVVALAQAALGAVRSSVRPRHGGDAVKVSGI